MNGRRSWSTERVGDRGRGVRDRGTEEGRGRRFRVSFGMCAPMGNIIQQPAGKRCTMRDVPQRVTVWLRYALQRRTERDGGSGNEGRSDRGGGQRVRGV